MEEYIVQPGQSVLDVTVILYGAVGIGLAWLIQDNGLTGPTDRLSPGQVLYYRDEAVDQHKKLFLQDYQVIATIKEADMSEGIGFWSIEDYVVGSTPLEFVFAPYVDYQATWPRIIIKVNLQGSFYTRIQNATNGQMIADGQYAFTERGSYTYIFIIEVPGEYEIQVENLTANLTVE